MNRLDEGHGLGVVPVDADGVGQNADVLMCGSYNSDAILLYRTMKEQNWTPKLLLGQRAGFTATETVETVGATDMNDTLSTNLFALDLSVTKPPEKL